MSEYLDFKDYDGEKIRAWVVDQSHELERLKDAFSNRYLEDGALISLDLLNEPSVAEEAATIHTIDSLLGSLILTLGGAGIETVQPNQTN